MLRRDLLAAAGALLAAPTMARAQAYGQAAPPSAPPAYPPADARSVWLVGDSAPPNPAQAARRLVELTEADPQARDSYLSHGAVERLETRFAALLGKEDCAFLPTGTLANHLAIRVLCGEHKRAVVQDDSHVYRDESDSVQVLSGIHLEAIAPGVLPTVETVAAAVEEALAGPYPVRTGAVSVESPVRRLGGRMPSLATVQAISTYCREKGVRLHLDGARLLLAPPELDLAAYSACFDTVYVSLYKYLDAPFGAVLAGSRADIAKVRELRHIYGGLISQGWAPALLASAALETFPDRIGRAHLAARDLFRRLEASGKVKVRPAPDASNIFELEMSDEVSAAAFARSLPAGIRIGRVRDGVAPFFVNETILRRPVDEYVRIFLG
jgi:threonine aldolase